MAAKDSPLQNLFRVAVREEFGGKSTSNAQQNIDSLVLRPSWLVHKKPGTRDSRPAYNQTRANEEIASTFGVDVRGGSSRDWNDELQHARELPVSSLMERLERAKLVHKVLTEFGEASLVGAKAIVEGLVLPMNPNEPARSHVYLHNNIFFSRVFFIITQIIKRKRTKTPKEREREREQQMRGKGGRALPLAISKGCLSSSSFEEE